jgi:hypothetical protein
MRFFSILLIVVVIVLGACSSADTPTSRSGSGSGPTLPGSGASSGSGGAPGVGPGASLAEAMRACPVTSPDGSAPPGELQDSSFVGNGGLWTSLWPHGLVVVPPDDIGPDGSLEMKFPWWRGPAVRGHLFITGREVESGLPIRAHAGGYGATGFNASGIVFPVEGCYRITGQVGATELTFVTLVRTCSVLAELSRSERRTYSICAG